MHYTLKLTQVGNSVGVIFPKEALAEMEVEKGDSLHLVSSDNGYSITPYDPQLDKQLKLGKQFMKEYRDTFKALAK